jgi:caffeoyl-CoA O-methyltransferase
MSHPTDAFTTIVHPEVRAFLDRFQGEDDPLVARMEAEQKARGFPIVGRHSARTMELLARSIGARRVFELGSGFGYSAYFFARAVGPEGMVLGTEHHQHELDLHEQLFAGHLLKPRIRIQVGSAFDLLDAAEGTFDVIFVDIHKQGYLEAMRRAIPRLRPGGLLLVDNVLWGGKVARPAADPDTAALQAFDEALFAEKALDATILPVGDGLAVARKR